jgi:hypothetical protein
MNAKPEAVPGKRDLRLDSLRGLFLVCMTVNHLPTELRRVTDQPFGPFTAAEGFVFLSGLLAGLVYTRKLRTGGRPGLRVACVKRARTIYGWHIASFLTAFAVIQALEWIFGFCSQTSPQLFYAHPFLALLLGLTLLHQPGLLDLLPMYCGFVLLLQFVLPALESGKRVRVLLLSAAAWLAVQWAPPIDADPLYPVLLGSFNLFAWQMLFVIGVVIGHARACGQTQVGKPNPWVMAGAAVVVGYGFYIHHLNGFRVWPDHTFGLLLNKPALGLFRLADFGCVAYFVAIFASRFPRLMTWRPLAFLGRHSLPVVAVQSVAVMMMLQFDRLSATATARTLTALSALALIFLAAACNERWNRSRKQAAPTGATGSLVGDPNSAPTAAAVAAPEDIRAA